MERRLAAIMATDVVGYSRLIRADEEGTLAALTFLAVFLKQRAHFIDNLRAPSVITRSGKSAGATSPAQF